MLQKKSRSDLVIVLDADNSGNKKRIIRTTFAPMQIDPKLSLILASKSPRRSYLLEQAGIPFTVRTAETEEIYPEDTPVMDVAPFLAELKAEGAAHLLHAANEVLLTADSVVIQDGVIYGKPKDSADAKTTLRKLSGARHTVVTGCCLMSKARKETFASVTEVYLDEMTDAEIDWYIEACKPFDKAGSYGIQEWVGLAKINRIEGTYPNVMGLPVDMVYARMLAW